MAIQLLMSCHGQTLIPSHEQCEQPSAFDIKGNWFMNVFHANEI
jgi:hypothetical protein